MLGRKRYRGHEPDEIIDARCPASGLLIEGGFDWVIQSTYSVVSIDRDEFVYTW